MGFHGGHLQFLAGLSIHRSHKRFKELAGWLTWPLRFFKDNVESMGRAAGRKAAYAEVGTTDC
jgi:hypothetical protein